MKIQKRDVLSFLSGIVGAENLKTPYDEHFYYGLGRNRRFVRDECEDIQKAENKKLENYNYAIDKTNEQYASRADGEIEVNDNGSVKLDKKYVYKYNKDLQKIRKKFKKELDEQALFLKEEIEIKVHLVETEYFPTLPGSIGDYLLPMRKEPTAEKVKDKKKTEKQEKT